MTDDARLRLFELACEAAFLIATDANPRVAFEKFLTDITDEMAAGRKNVAEGSPGLRAAFRDAMGYSRRVDEVPGEDSLVAHGQLRVIDGGA